MNRDELYMKSLDYTQNAINRMAENSAKLKSWFLPVVSAFYLFFSKSVSEESKYDLSEFDVLWCIPLFLFVYLDGFYLNQERLFRAIYEDFADSINNQGSNRKPFDLKPTISQRQRSTTINAIFSISVSGFYSIPLVCLQFFIFHHSLSWFYGLIFPLLWIILGLYLSKKTPHNQ